MTMSRLIQVRLPEAQVAKLDQLVKQGRYASRSEAVRDGLRQLLDFQIPNTGDSVAEIREIRQKRGVVTAEELNKVQELLD